MQSISGDLFTPIQLLQMRAAHGLPICFVVLWLVAVGCAIKSKWEPRKKWVRTANERSFFFCFAPIAVVLFDPIGRLSTTNVHCTMHSHTYDPSIQTYSSWKMPYNLLFIFSPTLPSFCFCFPAFHAFSHKIPLISGTMGTRTFTVREKKTRWPLWAGTILQAHDTLEHINMKMNRKRGTRSALGGEGLMHAQHTIRCPLLTHSAHGRALHFDCHSIFGT